MAEIHARRDKNVWFPCAGSRTSLRTRDSTDPYVSKNLLVCLMLSSLWMRISAPQLKRLVLLGAAALSVLSREASANWDDDPWSDQMWSSHQEELSLWEKRSIA